ncbi:estradiol 17-beta-dehydrogenase 1 isoform X1 [Zalophus californianus]|uniref:Estradiol 17-beta-dehydrogenase 1 isoform X1 n=1 Tax=Zalophus californianus TaxID=9704 RepID=A0A6J2FQW9_ZALCA|nr:estradiol 17-beta-dehydrogenase 1 isoform X1 [Zalophus californianus]
MDRTVVLITGCSSGIGLHLALRLASDPSRSFKVYATLRDLRAQGPLWEAARARGCPPGSLETLQLDVRDADSVAAARARVTEGRVDVLVCNAGRGLLGPLEVHTAGAVGSVLDVNVTGTVRTLQAFLPDMKRRRSGRILVTGSMGGLMGLPFNAVYCASKFAIEGLCESLAVLLPPFGVHVSLIECGPVRTAFLEKQEGVPGGALDGADAETRVLFSCYQRHLERIFREAAQDPEEVTEVGAGRGPGTKYGARGVAASPRPAPGQRASPRRRRFSSPRCAPRVPRCATSAPRASYPWRTCAWPTPAAAATSPPCTARYSPTSPWRRRRPRTAATPGSALLPAPGNKVLARRCLPLSPLCPRGARLGGTAPGCRLTAPVRQVAHAAGLCCFPGQPYLK